MTQMECGETMNKVKKTIVHENSIEKVYSKKDWDALRDSYSERLKACKDIGDFTKEWHDISFSFIMSINPKDLIHFLYEIDRELMEKMEENE